MKVTWAVAGVLAVVAGCSQMKGNHEKEGEEGEATKMTLNEVPAAAREGLTREAGGATITKVDKESDKGKTIYETDVMMNGKNWEIKVDENGKLVSKKIDEENEEKEEHEKK